MASPVVDVPEPMRKRRKLVAPLKSPAAVDKMNLTTLDEIAVPWSFFGHQEGQFYI